MHLLKRVLKKIKEVGFCETLRCAYRKTCRAKAIKQQLSVEADLVDTKAANADKAKAELREARKKALCEYFAANDRIVFDKSENPMVTVLLILWNQAELTLACLEALKEQSGVSMEIMIVDNASSDETSKLLSTVDGATIIVNQENLGFLKAVNLGAYQAKGKYLLLLNNDAVVHRGVVARAVQTIQESDDIGAVGGRVILPSGLLQEAGSIVWQEGTCLGYARDKVPQDNVVMFKRDVDYCSGVFLLTPTKIFCDMGGFDLRYAPAYYEETDYCMRLWKQGLRVVYDPFVVLDHYEFGSSGTTDKAIKQMQVNQLKFLDAHRDFLSGHEVMDEKNILTARMRNKSKGRVLLIDDRVPMHKLGAGYPRANSILRMLTELGYFVTFYPVQHICDDWMEVYDSIPDTIEVMLNRGIANLEAFLEERKGYYDLIFISRPINMRAVKDIYKKRPDLFEESKVIYDAEALWATREIMEKKLQGKTLSERKQSKLIQEEVDLASFSHSVITVTHDEAAYFMKAGYKEVAVLGHAMKLKATPKSFSERKDILFVGSLADTGSPNVDSVVWFIKKILPAINAGLSEPIKFYVAGRHGANELKAIDSPYVELLGLVDDLTQWYNRCRIFIAPTRFAAGIPFKVHEAAAHGIPTVVTDILARQLGWQNEREVMVGTTADEFAKQCIRLYCDANLWQQVRNYSLDRIKQEHNYEHFQRILASVLKIDYR